ncbi:acyl-CoA dehydrogenase family protein [Streptomyces sp. NPDC006638]|uniref:acyl-CoA dehydrogenase family protein n=1 Tax=Streptomyces sp. NPDC006638 TaxID=3157183 RepID=UPI0033BE581C
MDLTPSERQTRTEQTFASLFDSELVTDLRRMGQRELGAGFEARVDEASADAREAVWRTLCDLGALRLTPALTPGSGLVDQVVLAQHIGGALYQSPWADTAAAVDIATAAHRTDIVARLADGEAAALAVRAEAGDEPDRPGPVDVTTAPGRVRAVRRFVAFAPDVRWLLLAGTGPGGETALLLVPADHGAVSWHRHDDMGRGDFYQVDFDGVPVADTVDLGGPEAGAVWAGALLRSRIRHAAYLLGLAGAALAETSGYLRTRRQFGRSLASQQAPAFRMADAATEREATRLLVEEAAWLADTDGDARLAALRALACAAELARRVATDAVQLHGAVGMTEEHDAQLFYRRAAVDSLLLGRPTELRRLAAPILARAYA